MKTVLITVRLTLLTPGGVTAPERATATDIHGPQGEPRTRNLLPLRRDPAGALEVPGTTVAGSLRAHCASRPVLAGLFGSNPADRTLVASPLQVLGCVLHTQPHVQIRTRTAIDRHRGAAANRTLHAVEQLPPGTTVDVMLRCDDPPADQLAELWAALLDWTPSLGRGSSLGAGRCAVTGLGRADYDLATADGLLGWLAIAGPDDYPTPVTISTPATPTAHRQVRFAIVEPVHIGAGTTTTDAEGHEVATLTRTAGNPVIPGSAIKGVLRSRAEYICRVCGINACAGSAPATCPPEQPCPPCQIFGRASDSQGGGARRAALGFPDAQVTDFVVETRRHVAIDRFTGSARRELLYQEEVLVAGRFTVQLDQLGPALGSAEAALLDAALADLGDGLTGIGRRTTAGYGTVRIDDDNWTPPDLAALADLLRTKTAS